MNNFNNNYNNWQQTGWSGYQPPFSTNLIYVTGVEEALLKSTQRNCDSVYFDQDKPVFYRVRVDNEGRKAWQQFNYSAPNPDLTTPATKADFANLLARLEELESRIPLKEVTANVESNG